MTEKELLQNVLDLSRLLGWLCYHTYDSRRSEPGFPDLVMVRGGRLLFVELKAAKGRVSPDQIGWMAALAGAEVFVRVWRPQDWASGAIERDLRKGARHET